jgi:hypothetical protein
LILYKYVSFNTAVSIIKNSSLGFSCADDLNDPFEATAIRLNVTGDMPETVALNAVRSRISRRFGILSLTRAPLNPLMWSHYGNDHRGIVIGIDVCKAGFNCLETNVIPASLGNIIYTNTKPSHKLPEITAERLVTIGEEVNCFHDNDFELFKRAFLYKSLHWGYEEEVRVVKNVYNSVGGSVYKPTTFINEAGDWSKIIFEGRPLYCLNIPQDSTVEIYLGCSVGKNLSRLGLEKDEFLKVRQSWDKRNIEVKNVRKQLDNWDLEAFYHDISDLY